MGLHAPEGAEMTRIKYGPLNDKGKFEDSRDASRSRSPRRYCIRAAMRRYARPAGAAYAPLLNFPHHASFLAEAHRIRFHLGDIGFLKHKPFNIIPRSYLRFCFIQKRVHHRWDFDELLFQ